MARHQPMSMEAMLDEERREVLALLEGPQASRPSRAPSSIGGRSPSPFTPRSPVRSMLDIAPVRSMLDVDTPPPAPVRSMLDVDSPPSQKHVLSTPSSPIEHTGSRSLLAPAPSGHPRSMSDAAMRPADFGPRANPRHDPTLDYQFGGIITNHAGAAMPKRVTMGGKRSSAMAEVMRGNDVSGLVLPGDRGRHSIAGPAYSSRKAGNKSKSPTNRLGVRSHSPALLGRNLSPAGRAMLGDNQTVDYNNAYRRLSDAALARSGGSLGELGRRKKSDDGSSNGRLAKDYLGPDGEFVEESSDDSGGNSSEEDERGRKAARSFDKKPQGSSESPEAKRQVRSLLAAAEEERIHVASSQPAHKYRSLLDEPSITVTNPSGEKERVKHSSKNVIHPATSFDTPPSGTHTPMYTDTEEDISDIKRAQKMSFAMTQVMETPESHRTIQIITRGDYAKLVKDAEEEHRPARKYLVATDMSDESTHALEWAIGTVLRDGDTLLAIYCVDEDAGIEANPNSVVPDESKAMKEQAAAITAVTNNTRQPATPGGTALPLRISSLGHQASEVSLSPAPSSMERSKAEEERYRAVKDIGDRAMKLLRKTRLQVRVIVEVLHCKNPKHLITEVIDLVNPTVILGSFSNYLVTKSSVPVMVARKKLRKQSKYKKIAAGASQHQVNNINNPTARSLAQAKID
ncbi:hypothetical protein QC763_409330 [Podospora pseudopauciseta]|uniref:UspA domain-containing protein n=2 Tax=Podospora TaxID=5144 RepID=A0ABR0HCT8_9PEZI|nr:hypothetical protein QC763_409330 [Podospora pseudopauciseta]KAK4676980.1 hypothetical protein QC764_409330 [Podospora pseudoanserina]